MKRLKVDFPKDKVIDLIFLDNGMDYTIKFFIPRESWQDNTVINDLIQDIEYFHDNGIEKNIRLVVIDKDSMKELEIPVNQYTSYR